MLVISIINYWDKNLKLGIFIISSELLYFKLFNTLNLLSNYLYVFNTIIHTKYNHNTVNTIGTIQIHNNAYFHRSLDYKYKITILNGGYQIISKTKLRKVV